MICAIQNRIFDNVKLFGFANGTNDRNVANANTMSMYIFMLL